MNHRWNYIYSLSWLLHVTRTRQYLEYLGFDLRYRLTDVIIFNFVILFIDSVYLLNKPQKPPPPPFSFLELHVSMCYNLAGKQKKNWLMSGATNLTHKAQPPTFPDSEQGKCRLVSLGTKEAILKLKFTFDPGQAGSLWRPNLSKQGAILTADCQATNTTLSCFCSFSRRDSWENVGTEIILHLHLAKTTRILILKANFKTMENMAP